MVRSRQSFGDPFLLEKGPFYISGSLDSREIKQVVLIP